MSNGQNCQSMVSLSLWSVYGQFGRDMGGGRALNFDQNQKTSPKFPMPSDAAASVFGSIHCSLKQGSPLVVFNHLLGNF